MKVVRTPVREREFYERSKEDSDGEELSVSLSKHCFWASKSAC